MGQGNERHWSELDNQGDYISGDVDEDGKDVVVGKNIDTRRNEQKVNVYLQHPPSQTQPESSKGRLMPQVEQELRGDIKQITAALFKVEAAVIKVESALSANSQVTSEQISAMRQTTNEQVSAMRATIATIEQRFNNLAPLNLVESDRNLPSWAGYATLILLTATAIFVGILVVQNALGGM